MGNQRKSKKSRKSRKSKKSNQRRLPIKSVQEIQVQLLLPKQIKPKQIKLPGPTKRKRKNIAVAAVNLQRPMRNVGKNLRHGNLREQIQAKKKQEVLPVQQRSTRKH